MENHDFDKNQNSKFSITTPQGEVEITWPGNQQPGFCPHCHKCIPFNSVVFKREYENGTEVYSGVEAVRERKCDLPKRQNAVPHGHIGECP